MGDNGEIEFKLKGDDLIPPCCKFGGYADMLSWAAWDAVTQLNAEGIKFTGADMVLIVTMLRILETYTEYQASGAAEKRELKISKLSGQLIDLVKERKEERWIIWGDEAKIDPEEPEPSYFLNQSEILENIVLLHLSSKEGVSIEQAKITEKKLKLGNKADVPRFLHWKFLMEYWEYILDKPIGASEDPNGVKGIGGPLVRFLRIMSLRAPYRNSQGGDAERTFIDDHRNKILIAPEIWIEMKDNFKDFENAL